jgi:hypothetical protein
MVVTDPKKIAMALANRTSKGTDKGPKIAARVSYDNGNVIITIPQRLTMDQIRYSINDKGKDVFGLCVSLGDLEFVSENGEEETVLVSQNVHLNVNNLR